MTDQRRGERVAPLYFYELMCTFLAFAVRGSYRSLLISDDTPDFARSEGSSLLSNDLADGIVQCLVVSAHLVLCGTIDHFIVAALNDKRPMGLRLHCRGVLCAAL